MIWKHYDTNYEDSLFMAQCGVPKHGAELIAYKEYI